MDPNVPYYPQEEHKSFFSQVGLHFVDFIQTLVVFGAIFALIYLFVAQPHKVSGSSMLPTFYDGDYILTDKISYRFGSPKFGDVIVLQNPKDESQDFIKRIIGLQGDTVMVQNGSVYRNGKLLNEPYLPKGTVTEGKTYLPDGTTITVNKGEYIVMGDNRVHSSDSRDWGTVTKEEIVGKTFFRYFPPQRFGIFNSTP